MPSPDIAVGLSPQEQAYVDSKAQELINEATDADRLKNKYNEIRLGVEEAKEDLDRRVKSGNVQNIEAPLAGEVGQDLTGLKNRAKTSEVYLKEILKLFVNPAYSHLIPVPDNNVGGKLVRELARQVPTGEIRVKDAPYLYLLVSKAINGQINNITQLENEFNNIQYLKVYNPNLFSKLAKVFVEAAKLVVSEDEAKKKFDVDDGEKITHIDSKEEEIFFKIFDKLRMLYRLNPKKAHLVHLFMAGLSIPPDQISELQDALRALGVSDAEEQNYLKILPKIRERKTILGIYEQYAGDYLVHLNRATEEFDVDKIQNEYFTDNQGRLVFDRDKAKKLKDLINEFYFEAWGVIHSNYTRDAEHALKEHQAASYYFLGLDQKIHGMCNRLLLTLQAQYQTEGLTDEEKKQYEEMLKIANFLKDVRDRYIGNIGFFAGILHNLSFYARDAEHHNEWKGFLLHMYPSQLAEFFDDDGLMAMVRRVIPQMIRTRLVKNKNYYPSDLTGGKYSQQEVIWQLNFKKEVERMVSDLAVQYGYEKGRLDWRLIRAITYGEAIGILTLSDVETIGTSYPESGNFKGVHPLLPLLFTRFNWQLGRGNPYAGQIAKWLLGFKIELTPKERSIWKRLWKKKDFVPEKIANEIELFLREAGDRVVDGGFSLDGSLLEVINMLNIAASLIDRAGWRIAPLWSSLKEFKAIDFKDEGFREGKSKKEMWSKIWKLAQLYYGNASLWWFIGSGPERLNYDLKTILSTKYPGEDIDKFFNKTALGTWQPKYETLSEEFLFTDFNGVKRMKSLFEIKQIRLAQLRGETFFYYLQRNPGEFFLLLSQMVPELVEGFSEEGVDKAFVFLEEEELKKNKEYRQLSSKKKEEIRRRREELIGQWGKQNFHILQQLREWAITNAWAFGGNEPSKQMGNFIDILSEESIFAFQKMFERGKNIIFDEKEKKIFIKDSNAPGGKKEITQDEIDNFIRVNSNDFRQRGKGREISQAIFNPDNGLIKILTNLPYDNLSNYLENFGDFNKAGFDNIFYRLANVWTLKEADINPFSSDYNHFEVFRHMGSVGEDTLNRLQGDVDFVYEAIKKVGELPSIIAEAAASHSFEKIYEVHDILYKALSGAVSVEYANRANYILAQAVIKFFMEHNLARDPRFNYLFPVGWFLRNTMGKNLSLSKLVTGDLYAYSMDTNAIRSYLLALSRKVRCIPEKGAWSEEQLNRVFESTMKEFIIGDYFWKFLWFLIIFILLVYMKKAFEESEEKKH